jgi:hypothetical protein
MLALNLSRSALGDTLLRVVLSAGLLTSSVAVTAEIYQWKDQDGQTVFSEAPPADAAHQVVKPKFARESPAAIDKLKAQTAPPREPAKGTNKTAEKPKEPTAEERKANCAKARSVKTQLETSTRLRVKDEQGNVAYISETERQKRMSDTEKSIQSWCK